MKYKKSMILLLLAIFIFSIATVNAGDMNDTTSEGIMQMEPVTLKTTENEIITDNPNTFSQLDKDINASHDTFEMKYDYTFSNETDSGPVVINKSNFTINGNNHVLDANMQSGIFNITGSNITINNLVFINGNSNKGGAIYATGHITLNNVTFIANNASRGGAILINDSILNCAGSRFIDNYGEMGSSIYLDNATLKVSNSSVTSHSTGKYGQIYATDSSVSIDDSDFINITSAYASALYFENSKSSITNSRFINLTAEKSAGAIAIRWTGNSCIKGCEFINTKSIKNAGAIMVDYGMEAYNATVTECAFINSSSMIGGAYIQLGGSLILNGSNFTNNNAQVGGAVYISFTNTTIDNCIFESNKLSGNHYGGAVYCDISNLALTRTEFLNNSAYLGNAVYTCDSCYNITSCVFKNNANAIFTDFDKNNCILNNNEYTNDSVITNQSFYSPVSFEYPGLNLTLIDNTISISTPPSRFDLRDWGWITPVKNQGRMGSCWTFAFGEALETALLKATGIRYDVSENYIQNLQIRYSEFGDLRANEGGGDYTALANVVSWLSVGEEEDEYDEVGKLSVFVESPNKIHLHDVLFIRPDAGNYVDEVKKAILNYGAVSIAYASSSEEPYFNADTSAQYTNESLPANHAVAIIGWDDNYSADNFLITPPENGAWIVKNSWGTEWGDEGYFYLSYYEKSLFTPDSDTGQITFTACIFTNNIDYHVNYQTDLSGLNDFDANYTQYSNEFTSQYDDLIAAVGTYFNQSGINYSFDIYMNDKLAHSQSGVSEFAGYRTIVLSKYVSVKKGDKFKVVFKNNNLPYQAYSRQHYIQGMSFVSADGSTWKDITLENRTVCLKVYTVALNDASVSVENDTMDLKVDETCAINATINPDTIMLHIDYISGNESVATVDKNGIVTAVGEGRAIITLEVGDDEIYAKNSTTVTVTVTKIDTSIDVDSSSLELEIGDNSSIVATLTPADAGNVTFTSSNSSVVAVDAKGNVKAVGVGKANIIVSFAGDDKYAAAENKTVEVTVVEYMVVSAPDLTKYYNGPERFVVIVTDSKGNPLANQSVNITINGVTYSRTTNDNGTASMAIRLVGGQYNVTTVVGDITVYSTVTVLPTVNATDLVKVFRNGTQFYATFKDSNGDYLPEGTMVSFNINGVFYDRQVSGDKGLVKLNINIQQGQYVITSMNLVTGENASNNVTVISRLVENNDLTKYYRNDSQYTVKVIGDDGNAVGAGEIVTFNVHGVLYNRTTNESGIAKLNINLGPGDYIITAEHKDCRVSNNITVLPVLTAKDLSKKYGTPDQFIANLVDGQGNPFAGETVQFNVNGVLYDRVTDSNGQAKLNIRLMPGKYIITSSYNGASISNNIIVSA